MLGYYLFLKPGSTVNFSGSDLGETQDGIRVQFVFNTEQLSNQKLVVPVGLRAVSFGATCEASFISFKGSNLEKLLLLHTSTKRFPDFSQWSAGVLILNGKTVRPSKEVTVKFYSAKISNAEGFTLGRIQESKITVSFMALYDNTTGYLGELTVAI